MAATQRGTDGGGLQDAAIGRNLAETAALNAPGHQAGREAAAAVRRQTGRKDGIRRQRRGLLWLAGGLALFGGLAAVLEGAGL